MLGFCGLSLVAWQEAMTSRSRGRSFLAALVLLVSLAGAVCSHYYSVLLFVPLGLGELVRTFERRRLDGPVWLALIAGATPLIAFLPLIRPIREQFMASFWGKPTALSVPMAYGHLFEPLMTPLIVAALFSADRLARGRSREEAGRTPDVPPPPRYEVMAATVLLALPLVAFTVAALVTNAFSERYLLPTSIGAGVLLAFTAHRLADARPVVARALAGLLLVGALLTQLWHVRDLSARFEPPGLLIAPLRWADVDHLPIVVSQPDLYLQLAYYAPRSLSSRFLYVGDEVNTAELILDRLRLLAPLRVERFGEFWAARRGTRFVISGHSTDWLLPTLVGRGARVQINFVNDHSLCLTTVQMP